MRRVNSPGSFLPLELSPAPKRLAYLMNARNAYSAFRKPLK